MSKRGMSRKEINRAEAAQAVVHALTEEEREELRPVVDSLLKAAREVEMLLNNHRWLSPRRRGSINLAETLDLVDSAYVGEFLLNFGTDLLILAAGRGSRLKDDA